MMGIGMFPPDFLFYVFGWRVGLGSGLFEGRGGFGLGAIGRSFFTIPMWHFPWSEKGREARQKTEEAKV
jgi:hypothetical protein